MIATSAPCDEWDGPAVQAVDAPQQPPGRRGSDDEITDEAVEPVP